MTNTHIGNCGRDCNDAQGRNRCDSCPANAHGSDGWVPLTWPESIRFWGSLLAVPAVVALIGFAAVLL